MLYTGIQYTHLRPDPALADRRSGVSKRQRSERVVVKRNERSWRASSLRRAESRVERFAQRLSLSRSSCCSGCYNRARRQAARLCTLTPHKACSFRLLAQIVNCSTPHAGARSEEEGRGRARRVRWPLSTRHRRQRSSACQKRPVTASDRVAGTRLMHILTQQPTSASVRRAVATPCQVTPYRLGTMPNARLPHRAYLGHRARPPLHPLAHATSTMPPAGVFEHVHVRPAARVFIACLPSATHHPPYPLETASLT